MLKGRNILSEIQREQGNNNQIYHKVVFPVRLEEQPGWTSHFEDNGSIDLQAEIGDFSDAEDREEEVIMTSNNNGTIQVTENTIETTKEMVRIKKPNGQAL